MNHNHHPFFVICSPLRMRRGAGGMRAQREPTSATSLWLAGLITLAFAMSAWAGEDLKSQAHQAIDRGQFSRAVVYLEHIDPTKRGQAEDYALAYSYYRIRDLDRAESLATAILDHAPDDEEALLLLGDIRARQGNWSAALNLYLQVAEAPGAPPEHWLRVGQAWQRLGEPDHAEEAFGAYRKQAGLE